MFNYITKDIIIKFNDPEYKPTFIKFKSPNKCKYFNVDFLKNISEFFNDMASEIDIKDIIIDIDTDELLDAFCVIIFEENCSYLAKNRFLLYQLYNLLDKYGMKKLLSDVLKLLVHIEQVVDIWGYSEHWWINGSDTLKIYGMEFTYHYYEWAKMVVNFIDDINSHDNILYDNLKLSFVLPLIDGVFKRGIINKCKHCCILCKLVYECMESIRVMNNVTYDFFMKNLKSENAIKFFNMSRSIPINSD